MKGEEQLKEEEEEKKKKTKRFAKPNDRRERPERIVINYIE